VTRLSVVQQPPNAPALDSAATIWRTCVRQVAFVDDEHAVIPHGLAVWHDDEAYAHLLEVVCGLHSPITGETEVLHQFKLFAESLPIERAALRDLCTRIVADARSIRARHLIGLGSRSYGSAARRYLRESGRVAMIGTGMLAQEIVPFLVRPGRVLDLWGRRPECAIGAPGLTYRPLRSPHPARIAERSAMVVAAPIDAAGIARCAARYTDLEVVVDLRAEGEHDPLPPIAPVISLADVFADFQSAAHAIDLRVAAAKEEIRHCARAFAARVKLNPSGWHDLCA
jgi:glutamyl-tRNA reductase